MKIYTIIDEQVRYARVAKLVDAQHSKCCDLGNVGSSPTSGTIYLNN